MFEKMSEKLLLSLYPERDQWLKEINATYTCKGLGSTQHNQQNKHHRYHAVLLLIAAAEHKVKGMRP